MSQTRESLAAWLRKNSGPFTKLKNGNFYFQNNNGPIQKGQYFTHPIDAVELKNKINQQKSLADKQQFIKNLDSDTLNNAFHVALSKTIYQGDVKTEETTVLAGELKKAQAYGKDEHYLDVALGFKTIKQYQKAESVKKYDYRYSEYYWTTEYYPADEPSDKSNYEKYLQKQNAYDGQTLKTRVLQNHRQLNTQSIKDRVSEQIPLQLRTLLEEYKNDAEGNAALFAALLPLNKEKRTPLQCALEFCTSVEEFQPLLDRIRDFSPEQKEELVITQGLKHRNLLHLMAEKWQNLKVFSPLLDGINVRKALIMGNDEGNTPMHDFCRSPYALEQLQEIQSILKQEVKHIPDIFTYAKVFDGNNKNQNPLHIVCQRKNTDQTQEGKQDKNIQIVLLLHEMMGEKLFGEKLQELDKEGMTPLGRAVETGNLFLISALVANLSSVTKRNVLLAQTKNSVVSHAIKQKKSALLGILLENLDPKDKQDIIMTDGLIAAITANDIPMVGNLLQGLNNQALITPAVMISAVKIGEPDVITALLANLSSAKKREIFTEEVLCAALQSKKLNVLRLLLDPLDPLDKTAIITANVLNEAVNQDNPEIVRVVTQGLSPDYLQSIISLEKSVASRNLTMVGILVDGLQPQNKQVVVTKEDKSGITPLHIAIKAGDDRIVKKLLQGLQSVNEAVSKKGIFEYACQYGNHAILDMVVKALTPAQVYSLGSGFKKPNNPNLSQTSYDSIMQSKALLNAYVYFQKVSYDSDTRNRLNDFLECLSQLEKNLRPKPCSEKIDKKGRYYNLRQFDLLGPQDVKEFYEFIEAEYKKSPIDKDGATKNPIAAMLMQKTVWESLKPNQPKTIILLTLNPQVKNQIALN